MSFSPHLAEISCDRKEPNENFDHDFAARSLVTKFRQLAEKIVLKSWLKELPDQEDRKKKAEEKIRQLIEFDERMRNVKEFMKEWNRWRAFYFSFGPTYPKNKGHLTTIENALSFAAENNLKLPILIGAVHKAYQKRKFMPNYNEIMAHGLSHYARYEDSVVADLDRAEYEEKASRR